MTWLPCLTACQTRKQRKGLCQFALGRHSGVQDGLRLSCFGFLLDILSCGHRKKRRFKCERNLLEPPSADSRR